jgi:protocatechuate 3,4-dioxygenase beta subunit
MIPTRRAVMAPFVALAAMPLLPRLAVGQPVLEPTPECSDEEPTPRQAEGPFFRPDAPLRRDLAADAPGGEAITVGGQVVDTRCRPIPGAVVQIWHADARGAYDNSGFRLRGHQIADEAGRWWFTTIIPAPYPGRTRHYHIKAQRPGGHVLTTQLYFPNDPRNASDRLFDPRLLLRIAGEGPGRLARFDLVL